MTITRRDLLATSLSLALAGATFAAPSLARAQDAGKPKPKLIVGTQDAGFPHIAEASGVYKDAPYEVEWAVLPGPAAQFPALYSKSVDIGWLGDTSLILEQAKSTTPWTPDTAPLRIVAGWRNFDPQFRQLVTVVRNSADVKSLSDLRGKKWAFNYGGINHLQYVLSLVKAGLQESDIEPVQLGDGFQAAAAFNAGRTDVYSGDFVRVKELVDKGEARILLNGDALGIPGLTVYATRQDVLQDPERKKQLADFLARGRKLWAWYDANLPAVEKIYVDKVKYTPDKAVAQAGRNKSQFVPIDAKLLKEEQNIADVLFERGFIKNKVNVNAGFAGVYNAFTIGGAAAQ